jgi:hypothetical protein
MAGIGDAMAEELINNENLSLEAIPGEDADFYVVSRFALTFDGYSHWGDFHRCGEIANNWRERYLTDRQLPDTLTLLRTCLFFEQRRFHHFGEGPDGEDWVYFQDIARAIRDRVQRNERG